MSNKALLTTVGQRKKPGSSLNVILEQSGLITQEALDASEFTVEFAGFINQFLEGDPINDHLILEEKKMAREERK